MGLLEATGRSQLYYMYFPSLRSAEYYAIIENFIVRNNCIVLAELPVN